MSITCKIPINPTSLSAISYSNGFTVWHCRLNYSGVADGDTIILVDQNRRGGMLSRADKVYFEAGNGAGEGFVTAVLREESNMVYYIKVTQFAFFTYPEVG